MKWLVDNALSPVVSDALRLVGYDALHVRDAGLATAEDAAIFEFALREQRIIVSADTDFGTLLAKRLQNKPSVVLFRGVMPKRPGDQAALLLANLPGVEADLRKGAVVVIEPHRVRVRSLPLLPAS